MHINGLVKPEKKKNKDSGGPGGTSLYVRAQPPRAGHPGLHPGSFSAVFPRTEVLQPFWAACFSAQ